MGIYSVLSNKAILFGKREEFDVFAVWQVFGALCGVRQVGCCAASQYLLWSNRILPESLFIPFRRVSVTLTGHVFGIVRRAGKVESAHSYQESEDVPYLCFGFTFLFEEICSLFDEVVQS